jgi:O-succinylbenzoic acid--CoA ligase
VSSAADPRARPAADPVAEAARREPGRTALDAPRLTWSYGELDAAASAVARIVRKAAAPPARRVGLLMPRGPVAVAALHGVPRSGAAAAPLHSGWTEPELAAYLELLEPDLLLASDRARERAEAVAGGVPVHGVAVDDLASREAAPAFPAPEATSTAHTIIATSGTSGRPRAVVLSLENHLACARGAARRMALSADDRWLASLSLAHVGGVAMAVRAAVTGARLVLRGDFTADRFHRMVDRGRVTHASLVPTMLRRVVESRRGGAFPTSLRGVLIGGDATDRRLVGAALELALPVHLTYGLTEAASQVATGTPELAGRKPEAVGPPLPGVDVRIGDGEEIQVSGPTVAREILPGGRPQDRFEHGWLRTGDAGRLDGEGHLHVTGRLSARIVTGGVTVDPAAIEAVLLRHPAVRGAVVVGLPDAEWGERVAALVAATGDVPSPDELTSFCRSELSAARLPRRFRVVEAVPRNANGKPDREAARKLLED